MASPAPGLALLLMIAAPLALAADAPAPTRGPASDRVVLLASKDGQSFDPSSLPEARGWGPTLFALPSGRAALWRSVGEEGRVTALIEREGGGWEAFDVAVRGVGPCVVGAEGGLRAYVATGPGGGRIDVWSSEDGSTWKREGEAFRDGRWPNASDPDVVRSKGGWVMLLSVEAGLLRATSADGLRFVAAGPIGVRGRASATVAVEGGLRTYFEAEGRIGSAFSTDGVTWKGEPGDRAVGLAEPTVLRRPDGTWWMAARALPDDEGPYLRVHDASDLDLDKAERVVRALLVGSRVPGVSVARHGSSGLAVRAPSDLHLWVESLLDALR